jgi:Folate-sensitive fragile site protein Fra10Ac1
LPQFNLPNRYAIVDLSMHTTGRIGLRWRTEAEVISGRGQFTCASKHCESDLNLHSYEVPFDYSENNIRKSELVKVRVCINCARKLFYEKLRAMKSERRKKRRRSEGDDDDTDSVLQITTHDEILRELFDFHGQAECKEDDPSIEKRKKTDN